MLKTAAAQTMADLSLTGMGIAVGDPYPDGFAIGGSNDWAVKGLAELLGRTALDHARAKREFHIGGLDPDIASLQSVSLSAKLSMQRERSYAAHLSSQRGYFERMIEGALS
jgi:hypothetical protein